MQPLEDLLAQARERSWSTHGRTITFYVPGMFVCDGVRGKYPAVSITGERCALNCDHCGGSLLKTMIPAQTPEDLLRVCRRLERAGHVGVLLSGGCDEQGRLPWPLFFEAIGKITRTTGLYVSVHCGLVEEETARALKQAGVQQALLDVIGDDETYQQVYHVPYGVERITRSMEALARGGLAQAPHIVCGLHYGKMRGEVQALGAIARFPVEQVVVVSYMRIPGTATERFSLPQAQDVAALLARARIQLPEARISLGCARERGNTLMEVLAVDAGVNRMALPSEEAMARARYYGLAIRFQRTCCSISKDMSTGSW